MKAVRIGSWGLAVVFLATGLIGCSENNGKQPKIKRVEGVAKKIDLQNNSVSMVVKDDKGAQRELTGTVRENTEVIINGRVQTLKDVREGDQVVVYGYREGEGEDSKLVATKVEVTRARDGDWKTSGASTAKPTTPPAANTDEKRAQTTDMIYAQIRIRMQESIVQRAELLKAGKPRSDPEIRKLEGMIMKARDLLTEAGEVVADVEPPILETPATTQPAAKS